MISYKNYNLIVGHDHNSKRNLYSITAKEIYTNIIREKLFSMVNPDNSSPPQIKHVSSSYPSRWLASIIPRSKYRFAQVHVFKPHIAGAVPLHRHELPILS